MELITVKDLDMIGATNIEMAIRQLREPLLKAFDIYKSNIAYGVETETDLERSEIMSWYYGLLEKEVNALEHIPLKIQRYL